MGFLGDLWKRQGSRAKRQGSELRASSDSHGSLDEVDFGPLVPLFQAVGEGFLPLKHAQRRARALGEGGAVTPIQLDTLAEEAFRRAPVDGGRAAWALVLLVYEAADAAWSRRHEPRVGAALVKAGAELVDVASHRLDERGDFRIWTQAMTAAHTAAAVAQELGMSQERGKVLQRRGSLVLDCYTAGRTARAEAQQSEFQQWIEKASYSNDPKMPNVASAVVDATAAATPSTGWPSPLEAMDSAEADLRAALPLVASERRGRVLKALTQVLEWRTIFGGPPVPHLLIPLCEQALAELPPDDIQARLAVTGTLVHASSRGDQAQGSTEANRVVAEIEDDWDGLVRQLGSSTAWEVVGIAALELFTRDPERAMRLLALQRTLTEEWAQEARRTQHLRTSLELYATNHTPAWVEDIWASADSFDTVASAVYRAADRTQPAGERWLTPDQAMAALTRVMMASTKFDRERVGLQAVPLLNANHGPAWDQHLESLRLLIANLHNGEAVNLERRGLPGAAIAMYLSAATRYLSIGIADRLIVVLNYIAELVEAGHGGELSAVSGWCAVHSLRVELLAPESGPTAVQRLVAATIASQTERGTSVEMLQQLLQVAKGRRFAAALGHGIAGWSPDDHTRRLLVGEAAAEARLPNEGPLLQPPSWEAHLDPNDLVTAYVSEFELSPSDTAEDEVSNRQRAVERRIVGQLTPLGGHGEIPSSLKEIKARLDARTAVLQLYEGRWTDGRLATYSVLVTDKQEFVGIRLDQLRSGMVSVASGGREVYMPAGGFYVAAVRRSVLEDPAPLDVSRVGAELLEGATDRYASPLIEHLDELRAAGKDRLVVVPHSALHFMPLHLAGPAGEPLADQWTVTYLHNLAQLAPRPVAMGARRRDVAVFALGYQDQARLPPLGDSAAEGRAVASILGVEPTLDAAATKRAFIQALETCRFVHLRAHGQHNVDAPLFQTVFLAPGDSQEGWLRAHELLALDLHGLELVTLGACETALGRMDISDNMRGMPAALLLAGARAVIGTLWEVAAAASSTFFTELYRCLVTGEDDPISAFARAQETTRAQHPEYRDWGAFTLSGGYTTTRSEL